MSSTARKKRILPEWMISPGKESDGSASVGGSLEKRKSDKSIKDFFNPRDRVVNKSLNLDVFDFDIGNGSDDKSDKKIVNDDKYSDDLPTVYIMSPAELEQIARQVLAQN